MRIEDLDDRTHADVATRQLDDLAAIGLTWDDPVEWQSEHASRYDVVIDGLVSDGQVYECYCSRRDIAQAPQAPHAPQGAYPGICRDLTDAERETRRRETGRPPALRLRTDVIVYTVTDVLHGATPALSTTSWSVAATVSPLTTWRSWSTTPPKASTRWYAATICCPPPPAGLPRRPDAPPGADLCARCPDAERRRRAARQTRRRSDTRRDRVLRVSHRSPIPLAGRRRPSTSCCRIFDRSELPGSRGSTCPFFRGPEGPFPLVRVSTTSDQSPRASAHASFVSDLAHRASPSIPAMRLAGLLRIAQTDTLAFSA